jgi:hypothetical protein
VRLGTVEVDIEELLDIEVVEVVQQQQVRKIH